MHLDDVATYEAAVLCSKHQFAARTYQHCILLHPTHRWQQLLVLSSLRFCCYRCCQVRQPLLCAQAEHLKAQVYMDQSCWRRPSMQGHNLRVVLNCCTLKC